jgi:hypothetical protein
MFNGSWSTITDSGMDPLTVDTDKGTIFGGGEGVSACGMSCQQYWYFAEGSTAHGFEEYLLVENAGEKSATIYMVLMTPTESKYTDVFSLAPRSRTTYSINQMCPNSDVSVKVGCLNSSEVVCERAMYWNNRIEGHDSIGVTEPSTVWYLPEGCTLDGFEEWACLQNPSDGPASVQVTYMTDTGPVSRPQIELPPRSRYTVDVNSDVGQKNVSTKVTSSIPIVAERAMYWDGRRGGHCSIGTTSPSSVYYLAEGSTLYGFDDYVLIQNPNSSAAIVDVTYLARNSAVPKQTFQIPANSRYTIYANKDISDDFSTLVRSNIPIIAERAMYWNNGTGKAGHDTIGEARTANKICFAEGYTANGFETWLCIMNPGETQANVSITYALESDSKTRASLVIPPHSRYTVDVNSDVPGHEVSSTVTSDVPIMAERAMYWNGRTGGHVSIGYSK